MDGTVEITKAPTESPANVDGLAVVGGRRQRTRVWAWPRMHHLLFLAFTLVSAVPIVVLAIWEGQTAFQNELDSVRERHLLVARNLTSTMSRYVKDLKSAFPLAFTGNAATRPSDDLGKLLASLNVIHVCVLNPDGSVDSVLQGLTDDIQVSHKPDAQRLEALRALAEDMPDEPVLSKLYHDAAGRPVFTS